jgi:hypothetical protein
MRTFLRTLGIPVVAFVLLGLSSVGVSGQETSGTVTITQGGTGQGTVTSSPEGINCTLGFGDPTGTCEATFPAGTRVKLKAVAADSSKFIGWAPVNSCPKPKSFQIEAGDLVECQPVFEFKESPTFLLQVPIEGAGTVTSEPAGINCTRLADGTFTDTACAENFTNGITVTLTATAADGWTFQGFSGDEDCIDGVVVMEDLTRCVATFVQL